MDDLKVKLFNNDQDKVVMPSITEVPEEQKALITEDITEAISGKKVKKMLIPEAFEIDESNFILNLGEFSSMTLFQKEALKSILVNTNKANKEYDTTLYLYFKENLIEFGKGLKHTVERDLPLVNEFIFDNKIEIYEDFKMGEPLKIILNRDITKMRLNL